MAATSVVSPPSELPKFGDAVRKPLLWGGPRGKNRRGSNLANAAASQYTLCCYQRPAIFYKPLNNKRSMFSRPRHGVRWKPHVHCCSTTRSPPLYVRPTRSYAPSNSGSSFCSTLYFTVLTFTIYYLQWRIFTFSRIHFTNVSSGLIHVFRRIRFTAKSLGRISQCMVVR